MRRTEELHLNLKWWTPLSEDHENDRVAGKPDEQDHSLLQSVILEAIDIQFPVTMSHKKV